MARFSPPRAEYSIAAASKLTGISCHALRVWERRYGFPRPRRSASGHRRYGLDQVEVLRLLATRARKGESIGDLIAAYRAGELSTASSPEREPRRECHDADARSAFLTALFSCDATAAESLFARLVQDFAPLALVTQVIEPALVEAGERWFRGECDVFHEHFATGFLRRKLAQVAAAKPCAPGGQAPTIAIGTAQGDRHAGGVLLLEVVLQHAGWCVVNLGVDLPSVEYEKAVRALRPNAVGLSFVLSRNINKRFRELGRIRDVPVFVGGRGVLNYQGLARRHGLIPVPGPLVQAAERLEAEFAAWQAQHGGART